ncbi:myotubularin-like [Achlya hypogyna]|uniref:Myotubularin-like n=1 Tax=Achlya hypogyna TaxID=1202772 RepID=A0A1V9Z605_ACHHY|nr:myotubularin-like [Achlya hypogyna]
MTDGICTSVQRNGERCGSPAAPGASMCAHHERLARLLALAPKKLEPAVPASATPASVSRTTTPAVASLVQSTLQAAKPSHSMPQADPSLPAALPGEIKLGTQACVFETYPGFKPQGVSGILVITNYRLRFEPTQTMASGVHPMLRVAMTTGIPTAAVAKLLYPQSSSNGSQSHAMPTQLLVQFRNLRTWCLRGHVQDLMVLLNRHCFNISAASLFAFARGNDASNDADGHQLYDIARDFADMGVPLERGGSFRLTELNRNFTLCPTYPALFAVPARMTDAQVASVAEFRSKGRMPLLCWAHSNSASLWRCAQPKRGIFNAQSSDDELMLLLIAQTNHINQLVWIVDCRPELNARANNLKGGGTESSSIRHATVTFMDIANIHAMRDSLDGVRTLLLSQNPDMDMVWHARVEETKWLFHVRRVLSTAIQTANAIHNTAQTVVVHCSDGWDRTAQEWIKAGHKFEDRIGAGKAENDENSPVFLQFLDCVWQLLRQYPTYFEFNATALSCIFEHAISGRFGTLLCNCERERQQLNVAGRTPSLWSYMLRRRPTFLNPFFRPFAPEHHGGDRALIPPLSTVLRRVVLWDDAYATIAPTGNPSPAPHAKHHAPAPTAAADLADAYAAALAHIQALEAQLRKFPSTPVPAAPRSEPLIHFSTPAPPTLFGGAAVPATTGHLPSSAPESLFGAVLPSPSTTYPTAPLVAPPQVSLFGPPAPVESLFGSPPSEALATLAVAEEATTWKCRLCTKANALSDTKCVVCGRPATQG